MNASPSIGAYLRSLAADMDKLAAYLADPGSALIGSELEPWQQELLQRGNLDEIRTALMDEGEPLDVGVLIIIWPFR
jgi:hypothetical protein